MTRCNFSRIEYGHEHKHGITDNQRPVWTNNTVTIDIVLVLKSRLIALDELACLVKNVSKSLSNEAEYHADDTLFLDQGFVLDMADSVDHNDHGQHTRKYPQPCRKNICQRQGRKRIVGLLVVQYQVFAVGVILKVRAYAHIGNRACKHYINVRKPETQKWNKQIRQNYVEKKVAHKDVFLKFGHLLDVSAIVLLILLGLNNISGNPRVCFITDRLNGTSQTVVVDFLLNLLLKIFGVASVDLVHAEHPNEIDAKCA